MDAGMSAPTYAWRCKYCSGANEAGVEACRACGRPAVGGPQYLAPIGLLPFVRVRKRILLRIGAMIAAIVGAVMIASALGLLRLEESGGWMLLFFSMPWSMLAVALGPLGVVVLAIGVAVNAVAILAIAWWWLDLPRGPRGDS